MRWVRRAIVVACILLFAAGLNIVIAWVWWGRAVASGTREIPPTLLASPVGVWPEPSGPWPAPRVATVSCTGFDATTHVVKARWTSSGLVTSEANSDVARTRLEIRIGVPFRCASKVVRQENWFVPIPPGHVRAANVDDGVLIPGMPPGITLPIRPIWSGFIANTALIAIALFLAERLLGRVMRWLAPWKRLRMARRLCGDCGYDRRGLAGGTACPECGTVR
ncbi:MAG: hypothetical protein HEQ23_15225 [Tepidisphaera sp.]